MSYMRAPLRFHNSTKGIPMLIKVLFHTFMVVVTGGLWGIGLIVYAILKK
jgi:hypothetical protein